MEWADDVTNRPHRANAGSRLQELLQNGLDEEDEKDLQQLDNSSSDTSFTLGSDEETIDEVESDFDAEEVAGVLEGETVETEVTVRRAERQERQRERQRRLQRTQAFTKAAAHDRVVQKKLRKRQKGKIGQQQQQQQPSRRKRERRQCENDSTAASASSADDNPSEEEEDDDGTEMVDLRQRVRRRAAPTIPCAQRLAEAYARAAAQRAVLAEGGGNDTGTVEGTAPLHTHRGLNMGKSRQRPRRNAGLHRLGGRVGETTVDGSVRLASSPMPVVVSPRIALYDGVVQRVGYCSGVSVLQRYKVPTVVSFSESLPPVFQS